MLGADDLVDALVVRAVRVAVGVERELRTVERVLGVLVDLDHLDVRGDLRVGDHRDREGRAGVARVDLDGPALRVRGKCVAGRRRRLVPPVGAEAEVAHRARVPARGRSAVAHDLVGGRPAACRGLQARETVGVLVEVEGGAVDDRAGLPVVLDDLQRRLQLRVGRVVDERRVGPGGRRGRVHRDRVRAHGAVAGRRRLLEDVVVVAPRDVVVALVEGERSVDEGRVGRQVRVRVGAATLEGRVAVGLTPQLEGAAGQLVLGRRVDLVELDRPLGARVVDTDRHRGAAVRGGEADLLRVRAQADPEAVLGDLLQPVGLLPVETGERGVALRVGDVAVHQSTLRPGVVGVEVEGDRVERVRGAGDPVRGLGLVDPQGDPLQRVVEGRRVAGRVQARVRVGVGVGRPDREALGVGVLGPAVGSRGLGDAPAAAVEAGDADLAHRAVRVVVTVVGDVEAGVVRDVAQASAHRSCPARPG